MTDDTGGVPAAAALLVCLAAVAAVAAVPTAAATADDASGDPLHEQVETDEISVEVTVGPDGDATWRIEYRVELGADGNSTAAFESLAADVRANPENYTDRFADRITSTVRDAENATGRPMSATNFTVETETTPIYGIVAYTFEWSNFSNVTAPDRVVVGDAIGGFVMNADMQLLVRWPRGWTATDVAPAPDARGDHLVRWDGASTTFTPDQPRVVLRPATGTPTSTATATDTAGPATATSDPGPTTDSPGDTTAIAASGGGGFPIGVLALLALVVAGLGIAWWRFSGGGAGPTAPPGPDDGPAPGDGAAADAASGPRAGDGDTDDADGGHEPDEGGAPIDEELLSNEERVLRVLENNGGRAKQQEVVEALDWTEAKTSQVVSSMREEGTIDGFRLGRENVLTLPEEEIDPTEAEGEGGA